MIRINLLLFTKEDRHKKTKIPQKVEYIENLP